MCLGQCVLVSDSWSVCLGQYISFLEQKYPHKIYYPINNCSSDYPKHLVICEGYQKTLKCPSNHHVDITMGFYGRRNNVTCFRGRVSNTRCSASGVKSKLSEVCKGRTVCDVDSNSSVFGDPCWRTSKYLQLKYRCIPVVSPIPPSSK